VSGPAGAPGPTGVLVESVALATGTASVLIPAARSATPVPCPACPSCPSCPLDPLDPLEPGADGETGGDAAARASWACPAPAGAAWAGPPRDGPLWAGALPANPPTKEARIPAAGSSLPLRASLPGRAIPFLSLPSCSHSTRAYDYPK